MDNGWIKIHRKLLDWEWFTESYTLHLFIHLLLSANYEDKKWQGIEIERGQLVTSVSSLSEQLNMTPKQIRLRLKRLEESKTITTKRTNRYTLVTICNYCDYQDIPNEEGQTKGNQRANKSKTKGNQRATTKEYKNIRNKEYKEKEEKEEKESGAETSSAPPLQKKKTTNFIPPEIEEVKKYCEERGNNIDHTSFVDFYSSKGWMIGKNKMKDWRAAVRTWEKRNNQVKQKQNGDQYKNSTYREIEKRLTGGAVEFDSSKPKIPTEL